MQGKQQTCTSEATWKQHHGSTLRQHSLAESQPRANII